MQRLKDLPLAGRLGMGFGALALALIIVAAFAGVRIGALGAGSRDFYRETVVPAGAAVTSAAATVEEEVGHAADAATTAAVHGAGSARDMLIVVTLVALALAVVLAFWITRSVTGPVGAISRQLGTLDEHDLAGLERGLLAVAAGDLTVELQFASERVKAERSACSPSRPRR